MRISQIIQTEAEFELQDKARRERMQANDVLTGKNTQVRDREEELRKLATSLAGGMTQLEVTNIMGMPDKVGLTLARKVRELLLRGVPYDEIPQKLGNVSESQIQPVLEVFFEIRAVLLPVTSPDSQEIVFLYSPKLPAGGRAGLGSSYQFLLVWFNPTDGKVVDWKWMTPFTR